MTGNSIMNKEAKKWVEVLKTTELKQITGKLKKGDGFCCLGIACELNDPSLWSENKYGVYSDLDSGSLPKFLFNKLRLKNEHGEFDLNDEIKSYLQNINPKASFYFDQYSLVDLNDVLKLTFFEIGTFIEKFEKEIFIKSEKLNV